MNNDEGKRPQGSRRNKARSKLPPTADPIPEVTELRLTLKRNGWIPTPEARKACYLPEWPTACRNADSVAVRAWSVEHPDWTNTGLALGQDLGLVAIDNDVRHRTINQETHKLITRILGPAPIERVGKVPRRAAPYRIEGWLNGRRSHVAYIGDEKLAVEVLTSKLTAFGMHPSGTPYDWGPIHSPLDVRPEDLPVINGDRIEEMLSAVADLFRQYGARTKPEMEATERRGMEELTAATEDKPALAIAIVKALTNGYAYEDWINIGQALWNVCGEAGFQTWQAFCEQWPQNSAKVIKEKWESFKSPHDDLRKVRVGTLVERYAKPAGIWEKLKPKATADGSPILSKTDHDARALMFKEARYAHGLHWRDAFGDWSNNHHRGLPDADLEAVLRAYLKQARTWSRA